MFLESVISANLINKISIHIKRYKTSESESSKSQSSGKQRTPYNYVQKISSLPSLSCSFCLWLRRNREISSTKCPGSTEATLYQMKLLADSPKPEGQDQEPYLHPHNTLI